MEPTGNPIDEPFGRQPQPVVVTIIGYDVDVEYWTRELMKRAGFKDDQIQKIRTGVFKIYPRAVND